MTEPVASTRRRVGDSDAGAGSMPRKTGEAMAGETGTGQGSVIVDIYLKSGAAA
jgi:hypothetical protein